MWCRLKRGASNKVSKMLIDVFFKVTEKYIYIYIFTRVFLILKHYLPLFLNLACTLFQFVFLVVEEDWFVSQHYCLSFYTELKRKIIISQNTLSSRLKSIIGQWMIPWGSYKESIDKLVLQLVSYTENYRGFIVSLCITTICCIVDGTGVL